MNAYNPKAEKAQKPCGSCGAIPTYTIILNAQPVPACLRHLSHWRTPAPDYTCPATCVEINHPGREHHVWLADPTGAAQKHRDALADTGDAYHAFHGWVLNCQWCDYEAVGKTKAEALRGIQRHYDAVLPEGADIRG